MAADYFAGHMVQRGADVCFLTGTDEHGQKIEKSARDNGKSPKEHCDYIAEEFKNLWELLDIDNQKFVRTSGDAHKDFVTDFFKKVQASGDIYKGKYKGLYCVSCEDFKLEKDLELSSEGDLLCPTHKIAVDDYEQDNYFFALAKYEDKLKAHIEANPDFISPEYRKNEVLGWLNEGLRDFPISRLGIDWGIHLPDDENKDDQKIYVWFDALLGYLSGLSADRDQYWAEDSNIVHIIGKDILRFHAVYWPAMLMSAGFPLPKKVFGHGFLTKDGMKMGKTLGNIIDPIDLTKKFGPDAVRYYFLRELVFGRDGDFTLESFISVLNADLANNLGNLLNRCLNLVKKNYDAKIPDAEFDPEIKAVFDEVHKSYLKFMDELNPHAALDQLFLALNKVNAYINNAAPWKLIKEGKTDEAKAYLFTGLEACRRAAIYLAPLCPNISAKIFMQLGLLKPADIKDKSRRELLETVFAFDQLDQDIKSTAIAETLEPIFNRLELASAD